MANWKANVWMGSSAGEQTVTVQANTFHGARDLIKNIYGPGINDNDIRNLNEYREGGSSSLGESLGTIGVLVGIFGIIALWEVIVAIFFITLLGGGSFLGLGMYLNWKEEQDKIKAEEEANKNRPAQVSHKYRTEAFK